MTAEATTEATAATPDKKPESGPWSSIIASISTARDCSRCQGVFLAVVVIVTAALTLDAVALKDVLIGGMSLATALVMHGAGAQARGKTIDQQAANTSSVTVTNPPPGAPPVMPDAQHLVDQDPPRNG